MKALCLLLALLLGGCVTETVPTRLSTDAGWILDPGPGSETQLDANSPWRVVADGAPDSGVVPEQGTYVLPPASAPRVAADLPPAAAPEEVRIPEHASLALPVRRGPAASARGATTPEQLQIDTRRHFLRNPTRIVAERVTVYCTPALYALASLSGAEVRARGPGRQEATGGARLMLEELTVQADFISLRTREDGSEDFHVLARGAAGMVCVVGDNVLRHEGQQSLILTNDQIVPIP